jgi:hypothetical protein
LHLKQGLRRPDSSVTKNTIGPFGAKEGRQNRARRRELVRSTLILRHRFVCDEGHRQPKDRTACDLAVLAILE